MEMSLEGNKGTVIYIVVGIFLAFAINQGLAVALSTDMPVVAVESNSMVPTFYQGDILVIQGVSDPRDYKDFLKIGDVIVFQPEGRIIPIVHRIVAINPDGSYQTLGDANNGNQLPFEKNISPEQIKGKMIFIVPYLGWLKIGMTNYIWPNIFLVILILGAVTFLYYLLQK
jgi:signal peptidase